MPEPMRLFEAFRIGDDKPFYVALPDVDRTFDQSVAMVEAALAERFGAKFGICQIMEMGDITEWRPSS